MASSSPIFAKPLKRMAACVTDLAVVTCCGWFLINMLTREWYPFKVLAWGLPVAYWAYESACLWVWNGSSLGRRLLDIQVVSSFGKNDLALWQMVLRPATRVILYFAFVQYFKPSAARQLDLVLLPFLIEVALLYTAASLTIADIVARTRVINAAPPHPHSAAARRVYGGGSGSQAVPPGRHP
jgi:RDD family protein